MPESSRGAWLAFAELLESPACQHHLAGPIEHLAQWYEGEMERLFDDAPVRQADIQQLARIAATYPNLERFLTELTSIRRTPPATSRRTAPRRGLPDPLHHPLGQGAVE